MAKILIIDDDGITRDAIGAFLIRSGHEVLAASDGAAGLEEFRRSSPDLVILDRELPMLSGSRVLAGIKETSPSALVLVLTGYDSVEDEERYLAGGAAKFLSKASGLSPVLKAVEELLSPASDAGLQGGKEPRERALRALVADDDEGIRGLLSRFLSEKGFKVSQATDGGEAISLYTAERPDLVLLDIYMPVKDGVQVLEEIIASDPDASVMMITGNDDEAVARRCLELGAFDYIPKPVNLDLLGISLKARLLSSGR